MRRRLSAMDVAERNQQSSRIRDRIRASDAWNSARRVLGFVPLPSEPDLLPLLWESRTEDRRICVPRWNPELESYDAAELPQTGGLVPGPFAIPEPDSALPAIALERLDLILIPGLAFDRRGRRLGRGRGFFDRILRRAVLARRWGVAFDQQIVERVPTEPHDVNLHFLVTPQLWLPVTE